MRVIIADDHPLYSEALRLQIERIFPGSDVSEVPSMGLAWELITAGVPFDLALLDFNMPGMSLEALAELTAARPATPVCVISGDASPDDVAGMVGAGARGFIPKTANRAYLAHALQLLLAGGTSVPAECVLARTPRPPAPDAAGSARLAELNARERAVIAGLARGLSNKEIARELGLAEVTVKVHVSGIFRKTGTRTRSEAAVLASRAALQPA